MESFQVTEILANPLGSTEINGKDIPNPKIIERMLLALYNAQAFYAAHENFLSSVARFFNRFGSISEKQLLAVAKTLPAYTDKLSEIAKAKANASPGANLVPQPRKASAPKTAEEEEAEWEYQENRRAMKPVKKRAPKAKRRPLVLGPDGLTSSERAFKALCTEQFGIPWDNIPETFANAI